MQLYLWTKKKWTQFSPFLLFKLLFLIFPFSGKIPRKIFLWLLQFFSFHFLLIPLHSDFGLHRCNETAYVEVNADFHNAEPDGCFWVRGPLSADILSSVGFQSNMIFLLTCWLSLRLCCSFLPISSKFLKLCLCPSSLFHEHLHLYLTQ